MKTLLFFLIGLMVCPALAQDPPAPKNIIVMISDGCGFQHILASNYYLHGKAGVQVYESFPITLAMSTYPAKTSATGPLIDPVNGYRPDSAWNDFEYPKRGWTDSAPAATTMACGVKTYNGAIGVDVNFHPLKSITQRAAELGKSAGVVTSVPLSHATPAGFSAHNRSRGNYPEIAREMILDTKLAVIMGCGHPYYDHDGKSIDSGQNYAYVGGKAAWDSLRVGATRYAEPSLSGNYSVQDIDGDGQEDAWTFIDQRDRFRELMEGNTPKRVFGVPTVKSTLQQMRAGAMDTLPFVIPFTSHVPSLAEMSLAALNVLDNNEKGFFLMIEGGAVDWANHDNNATRMIEEQQAFNETVEAVVRWIGQHQSWENTLLVVTSDHECGYLTGPAPNDQSPLTNPILNRGKGKLPLLRYNSPDHTNMLVPFFAKGAGASIFERQALLKDPVHGPYLDNTNLAKGMFSLWE